jgi:putative multiple sugar transport system ATP-binding protein
MTVTSEYRDKLNIKCSSIKQLAVNLSGGNQQKVVLSKWLFASPEILILDEPTRALMLGQNMRFTPLSIDWPVKEKGSS